MLTEHSLFVCVVCLCCLFVLFVCVVCLCCVLFVCVVCLFWLFCLLFLVFFFRPWRCSSDLPWCIQLGTSSWSTNVPEQCKNLTYFSPHIFLSSVLQCTFFSRPNLSCLQPTNGNETLFGFDMIPDSEIGTGSMIVGWIYQDVSSAPEDNFPPDKYVTSTSPIHSFIHSSLIIRHIFSSFRATDTHERVRREFTAQEMLAIFFATGKIQNTCGGECRGVAPPLSSPSTDEWIPSPVS